MAYPERGEANDEDLVKTMGYQESLLASRQGMFLN